MRFKLRGFTTDLSLSISTALRGFRCLWWACSFSFFISWNVLKNQSAYELNTQRKMATNVYLIMRRVCLDSIYLALSSSCNQIARLSYCEFLITFGNRRGSYAIVSMLWDIYCTWSHMKFARQFKDGCFWHTEIKISNTKIRDFVSLIIWGSALRPFWNALRVFRLNSLRLNSIRSVPFLQSQGDFKKCISAGDSYQRSWEIVSSSKEEQTVSRGR